MVLEIFDIISAFFSLGIIVSFSLIGFTISSKYFKYKNRTFLFMGLFWICFSQLWWSSFINVFLIVTGINDQGLTPELYCLLGVTLLPFTGFFYTVAITDLIYKKYQKPLVLLEIISMSSVVIFNLYYLFTDPDTIVIKSSLTMFTFSDIVILGLLMQSSLVIIFGFLLSINLLKSDDLEIKLKGKLLMIAFTLFLIGGFLDTTEIIAFLDFIDRVLLIISAILFYCGFILPEWMKKIFIKNQTSPQ